MKKARFTLVRYLKSCQLITPQGNVVKYFIAWSSEQ